MDLKKQVLTTSIIGFALLLGGCATKWDVDISEQNTARVKAHSTSNTSIVKSKTTAIAEMAKYECSDPDSVDCGTAKAFSNVFGMQAVAGIEVDQYKGPVDKTGVDVQHELAKNGVPLAAVTGGTIASVKSKGETTTSTSGGSTSTYVNDEDRATSFGDDSPASSYPDNDSSTTDTTEVVE